jgi:hypothetical protein
MGKRGKKGVTGVAGVQELQNERAAYFAMNDFSLDESRFDSDFPLPTTLGGDPGANL